MDKELLKQVGARIRALRKERGLSQEALGEIGGFQYMVTAAERDI
ncbi:MULTISPECIES: hypothetical protein [unclassified Paenibacillus]|nr:MULTISPECIES: hypothetical protein [unclassified Paenibacillus]ETT47454.1 transcriptional regulator y4dJ [Paenibacillus sp. FSL R7-269]